MTLPKRLLREPLVQFLLLGGLLFLYFEWRGGSGGPGSSRIDITPGQIEHLGRALGADNDAVFRGLLGIDPDRLAALGAAGIV